MGAILPEIFEPLDQLFSVMDGHRYKVYSEGIGGLAGVLSNFFAISLIGGIVALGAMLWEEHQFRGGDVGHGSPCRHRPSPGCGGPALRRIHRREQDVLIHLAILAVLHGTAGWVSWSCRATGWGDGLMWAVALTLHTVTYALNWEIYVGLGRARRRDQRPGHSHCHCHTQPADVRGDRSGPSSGLRRNSMTTLKTNCPTCGGNHPPGAHHRPPTVAQRPPQLPEPEVRSREQDAAGDPAADAAEEQPSVGERSKNGNEDEEDAEEGEANNRVGVRSGVAPNNKVGVRPGVAPNNRSVPEISVAPNPGVATQPRVAPNSQPATALPPPPEGAPAGTGISTSALCRPALRDGAGGPGARFRRRWPTWDRGQRVEEGRKYAHSAEERQFLEYTGYLPTLDEENRTPGSWPGAGQAGCDSWGQAG